MMIFNIIHQNYNRMVDDFYHFWFYGNTFHRVFLGIQDFS